MLLKNNKNKDELPYERCLKYGTQSLTDVELLAILLRTGTKDKNVIELARQIVDIGDNQTDISKLLRFDIYDLTNIKGIGKVKAVQILSLIEFSKRLWKSTRKNSISFDSPQNVADYYMQEMRTLNREELRLALLDTKQHLKRDILITRGTVNASMISVRDLLVESLKHEAVNIILIHNHPSGNPKPSQEDLTVTKIFEKACTLVGLKLNDHVIIGDNKYYSFKEQGVL